MKKILAFLLLSIFFIDPTCLAAEIIVGADGQAMYADGVEIPANQEVKVEKVKEEAGPLISIETKTELEKIVKPYEKKNLKVVNKAKKEIDYQKALKEADINYLQRNGNAIEIQLQDGDYALWNPGRDRMQYAGEFHKDGSCMGIVKIKKLNADTIVFYEYRSDKLDAKTAPLKHIMIAYNDRHKAAFIYTSDKDLRCFQYEGTTFAIDLAGFPEVQKVKFSDIVSTAEDTKSQLIKSAEMIINAPFVLVATPFALLSLAVLFVIWKDSVHY